MEGKKLINRKKHEEVQFWEADEWIFNSTTVGDDDNLFYIVNLSEGKVLRAISSDQVNLEDFDADEREQLWYREKPFYWHEGSYFNLKNFAYENVLTPNFATNVLEMTGKTSLLLSAK